MRIPQTLRHIDLTVGCVRSTTTGQLTLRCHPVQGNTDTRQPISPGNKVDPRTSSVPLGKPDCLKFTLRVQLIRSRLPSC
jgi:hypothetical protein